MNSYPALICFVFFLFLHGRSYSQSGTVLSDAREQAATLYYGGNYTEAVAIWKDLIRTGYRNADIYYNIGNAESMQRNTAAAILAFEKAARYKPADRDVIDAIKRERSKIENSTTPIQSFFLVKWYKNFLALFRPSIWAIAGLIILVAGILKWFADMQIFNKGFGYLPGKHWMYNISGAVFLMVAFLSYKEIYRKNEAIVFEACELRQAPSAESPLLRTVYEGEKVKIDDEISGWNKVYLLNLDEGWISKDCLWIIDPNEED